LYSQRVSTFETAVFCENFGAAEVKKTPKKPCRTKQPLQQAKKRIVGRRLCVGQCTRLKEHQNYTEGKTGNALKATKTAFASASIYLAQISA